MIELRSVQAEIGRFRLSDIQLCIESGMCHVMVGPTGAGKTVLLETIIGIREPLSGNVLINGRDVSALPPNERQMAYVPQDTCLFPNMTVAENIRYGLRFRTSEGPVDAEFLERLTTFLQIDSLLARFPQNLSGGEKQRVALARALATKPALLILDEPFSAIDHSMREDIRRMIKELLEAFHTTTLIVTHDLDEAYFLGDFLSIIINGRIVQTGPREELYYYPKTLDVALFLGIKNLFPGRVVELQKDEIVLAADDFPLPIVVACKCAHKRFSLNQRVKFGIRAEAVSILRQKEGDAGKRCVFDAVVKKMYMRGKLHTIIVEVGGARKPLLEIDIYDAAARKIGIAEGGNLKIDLNPRHIFLLPDLP